MKCECRGYTTEDGQATLLLNTSVYGDVTIIVYHARSTFGGKVQGKVVFEHPLMESAMNY